jgi:low temperature requirement protein LtrA
VALGESVVAIGIGLGHLPLDARLFAAAVLGLSLACALWWTYFVSDAEHAERVMGKLRRINASTSPSTRTSTRTS